jgi:SAM-dependent methyltransferase
MKLFKNKNLLATTLPPSFLKPLKCTNKNFRTKTNYSNKYFQAKDKEILKYSPNELNRIKYCPVCRSSKKNEFIKKYFYEYVKCQNCYNVYLKNPIKKKKIIKLYKSSKEDILSRRRKNFKPYKRYYELLYVRYLKIINYYSPKKSNLLDIGCGDGNFIKFLRKEKKFNLFANELASSEAKNLKLILKNNFFNKSIENINFKKNKFHTITMWGVLEHLTNINLTFKIIKKILVKNGIIFFLIPNINSFAFKLLKEKTPTLAPRDHLNFFNLKSIKHICKKFNLKLIHRYQELPIIDLMYPLVKCTKKLNAEIIKNKQCYYDIYFLKNLN